MSNVRQFAHALMLVALTLSLSGCVSAGNNGILMADRMADKPVGPYTFEEAASSTAIIVTDFHGGKILVTFVGVKPTESEKVNASCIASLNQWLRDESIYLVRSSMVESNGVLRAIPLVPTTQYASVDISTGEVQRYAAAYEVIPHGLLETGKVVVDYSDNRHAYFKSFVAAESLAKKKQLGCWEKPVSRNSTGAIP